jgi:hypothetical protein
MWGGFIDMSRSNLEMAVVLARGFGCAIAQRPQLFSGLRSSGFQESALTVVFCAR